MNDDPYEWNPADQGTDRPEQREETMTTDLEQARKMLADEGIGSAFDRPLPSYHRVTLAVDTSRTVSSMAECPLTAARRAIEMYRLVKYGPEVVDALKEAAYMHRGELAHDHPTNVQIDNALAHFPQHEEQTA